MSDPSFLVSSGPAVEGQLSPVEDRVIGRVGEDVRLKYQYQTSFPFAYFHWYKQSSDLQAPQFILGKGAGEWRDKENIPNHRYGTRASLTETVVIIRDLTLADTALYYCTDAR